MFRQNYVDSMSTLRHQFDWLPDPFGSILLLCAAALIALLLSRLITGALPRLPGLRKIQFIHAIINRLRLNISYFLMIIAASAALPATEG
ncbi:mechanosensitive ion channel protein MscS, partial [Gluconobacter japonicus]